MKPYRIRVILTRLAVLSAFIVNTVIAQGGYVAVSVNKTVDNPEPAAPLQTIEFTIEVVSTGTEVAKSVIVKDVLPPELQVPDGMAAFTTVGVYDPVSGEWSVGDLEPEQTELMTLPAIVVPGTQPACVVNNVSMSINGYRFIDNRASVSIRLPGIESCADLDVSVYESHSRPRSCDRGGAVGYNFTVSNLGPDVARNVVLKAEEISAYKLPGFQFIDPECEGLTCRWVELQPNAQQHVTAQSVEFESQEQQQHAVTASVTTKDEDYNSENDTTSLSREILASECTPLKPPGLGIDAGGGGGGCFVATAIYGSSSHPDVQVLRNFRDNVLLDYGWGKAVIYSYYQHSPDLVCYIQEHKSMEIITRAMLKIFVMMLTYPLVALALVTTLCALPVSAFAYYRRERFKHNV